MYAIKPWNHASFVISLFKMYVKCIKRKEHNEVVAYVFERYELNDHKPLSALNYFMLSIHIQKYIDQN